MPVDGDLLCGIIGLSCEVAVIIKECLMLGIEFKTLILKIVPFFEYGLKLQGECITDELVLDSGLELFKQFY